MSTPAAPPAWVMALPLDPGAWRVLVGLWSYADFDADGEQLVGPSRSKLAARIGIKTSGLRKQISKLRELGWLVDDHGDLRFRQLGIRLAWCAPFATGPGGAVQVAQPVHVDPGPGGTVDGPGGTVDGPGGAPDRSRWPTKAVQVDTHTFQGPSNSPCNEVAERATPPDTKAPDGKDTSNTDRVHPRNPGSGNSVQGANPRDGDGLTEAHPGHVHDRHARAQRRTPAPQHFDLPDAHELSPGFEAALASCPAARLEYLNSSSHARAWGPSMARAVADGFTVEHMHHALQHWVGSEVADRPRMHEFWYTRHDDWREAAAGITRRTRGQALSPDQQTTAEIQALLARSSMGAQQ